MRRRKDRERVKKKRGVGPSLKEGEIKRWGCAHVEVGD